MCDFKECEACAAKPGTVTLCEACRTNRNTINDLNSLLRQRDEVDASIDRDFALARERIKALEWVIRIQAGHKE
jgi:hypothetical protein